MFVLIALLIWASMTTSLNLNRNFCVECKHFKKDRQYFLGTSNGKCALFPIIDSFLKGDDDNEKIEYLVSGKIKDDIEYTDCVKARQSETMCGPEGKYFKKKNNCFIDKSRLKLGPCSNL